jgi:hypothetical protein
MPALVISIDFEMFWGVTDSKTIENYGANVLGEWQAIPAILKLFKQYNVNATWATVGMLMCKDFKQWSNLRPSIMPRYTRGNCSTYSVSALARELPKLFFARPLVEQILASNGQELASHTYSHFYCNEEGATVEQFVADIECVKEIFGEYGVQPTSLVFPRNQVLDEYLKVLWDAGISAYRGNQDHKLYQDGHLVKEGYAQLLRALRIADSYLPLTGSHTCPLPTNTPKGQLINIPGSRFLRPVSGYSLLDRSHLNRAKSGMLEAARENRVFHLWWHPHNFGKHTQANLINLEKLLKYYQTLSQEYGMRSLTMRELDMSCRIH